MVTMAGVHRLAIAGLSILASTSSAAPTAGDDNTLSAILAPASAGIASAENVNCHGISRDTAVQALNWFCKQFDGREMKTSEDNLWGRYQYKPDLEHQYLGYYDEGEIIMTINVTSDAECSPSQTMSYDSCFSYGLVPVDSCNTASTEGKQGGTVLNGCLEYGFQPNPKYWPECAMEPAEQAKSIDVATNAPLPDNAIQISNLHAVANIPSNDKPLVDTRDVPDTSHHDLMASLAPQSTPSSFITLDLEDEDWTPPFCLNKCFGVSRQIAGIAADAFAVGLFGDNFRYFKTPADNVRLDYTYTPRRDKFQDHRWIEEGRVRVTIEVIPGTVCDEPYQLWDNMAYEIFMKKIIDKCNTDDEHVKQGGWLTHRCLNFTINPNPTYYPNCLTYG